MDAMKLSVSKEFIISTQPIGCITQLNSVEYGCDEQIYMGSGELVLYSQASSEWQYLILSGG
ncbi:hypothetical protein, partial [Aeromonas veronii]|uniref:hypothetical protein n=1 Tax=Aeromonas veronii TaxID=654 RepID=UPI003D25B605